MNSFYMQHDEPLDMVARVKMMSCTGLDMTLFDSSSSSSSSTTTSQTPLFQVKGKMSFLGNDAEIRAADGSVLYRVWQKRVAMKSRFRATKGSVKSDKDEDVVFRAEGSGGSWKGSFGLDVSYTSQEEGKHGTWKLKSGATTKVSQIVNEEGNPVAHITRSKADMWWWSSKEPYRIQVSIGTDASLVMLVLVCMHMQLLVYKAGITAAIT